LGVAVLDWILLSLTTRLDIVVTPTRLTFGLPIFKKNFALTALEVGGIEKISWLAGIGIHRWRSHWVFNAHFGRGVRLKAGRTYYLLGSEQPERLLAALQQAVPTRRVT
jgi:hypothetical protein